MRNFALTNLFLLTVAFLASCFTANVADAAPDSQKVTVINNDNEYSAFVAIAYGRRDFSGTNIMTYVQGWWEIKPNSRYEFDKGDDLDNFYLFIEMGNTPQKFPSLDKAAFYIHDMRFESRSKSRSLLGGLVVNIVSETALPLESHSWGQNYQFKATDPSSDYLKSNNWRSAMFYRIPRQFKTVTLGQHQ